MMAGRTVLVEAIIHSSFSVEPISSLFPHLGVACRSGGRGIAVLLPHSRCRGREECPLSCQIRRLKVKRGQTEMKLNFQIQE
jgi:hypothetical protein